MSKPKFAQASDKGRHYVHPTSGERWISITNALDMAVSKPALVPWAAKVTANAMWDRLPDAITASMGGARTREPFLREVKGQVRYVKDTAADLGTRVHDAAERLALGKAAVDDDEARPYAAQVLAWMETFGVNMDRDIEAAEATIINRSCGYAGTGDLWVHLHLAPDLTWTPRKRHLWLVDYKSSATRLADSCYPENGLQLAALANAETLLLDDGTEIPAPGPIAGTAVLNLRTDTHAFIPVPADRAAAYDAFCCAVAMATYLHTNTAKPAVVASPAKAST